MQHFLLKLKLIICGSGGGGGGQKFQAPNVSQYPAVLAPPQFSKLDTVSSFSYAEMIDLLSDGPIEGLINKNGKKLYDENIFEGIYLNDTPVKETSSVSFELVDISFLKDGLKNHFLKNDGKFIYDQVNLTTILTSLIENKNFNSDITIKSFTPESSIREFVKSLNASSDSIPLIEKTFSSSPLEEEKPFLTIIEIPKFTYSLNRNKFNSNEASDAGSYPLILSIPNISSYIYFSISSKNLNSFNYFELPRSFIFNNIITAEGKRTVKANLISVSDTYLEYDFLDIKIYLWSLYSKDYGYKKIDIILDKYFNNIQISQNSQSLFNYNLIESEFKNGMEYQTPLQYFNSIQIDTEYNKELIGPYKISGNYKPTHALNSAGGIQRVSSFGQVTPFSPPVTNINLESETSDDIRYVKSWPIEYDCKNTPYVICNAILNYSQFDRTSSSRVSQEAIPVTHYIENENVEEAFITINVNQLYDTNHIDLNADNSSILGSRTQSKKDQTDLVPEGSNTYSQIVGYQNPLGYTDGNLYLLIYGSSYNDGYVIDGYKTTGTNIQQNESGIINNLDRLNKDTYNTLYYKAIDPINGLSKCISSLNNLIGKNLYNASSENCLIYYQIPNDSYLIRESFNIKNYSLENLESKLKLTTIDNNSFYNFGLNQDEKLLSFNSYSPSNSLSNILNNYATDGSNKFFIVKALYRTTSSSELINKNIVGHVVNSYIDWDKIIVNSSISTLIYNNQSKYFNIKKYIADPYLYLNQIKFGSSTSNWSREIIGNIYLIGINGDYLRSTYLSGNSVYLSLEILDQLLEEYALKTDQSTDFKFPLIKSNNFDINFSTLKAFENILLKFSNGKLIGSSSIFNLRPYSLKEYVLPSDINAKKITNASYNQYDITNIYLIDESKFSINMQEDKIAGKDIIFEYNLYSNFALTSVLTPTSSATYVDFTYDDAGTQVADKTSPFVTNGSKMIQQISAGTRLPAIVTIDVETGYEKKQGEVYFSDSEFYCYRYSIYGIATDQALIDIGRKCQPFLISCKLSSDVNGESINYKNFYYTNNSLFLIEVNYKTYNATTTCYYLTKNKYLYNIGSMNNSSIVEDNDSNIFKILQNNIIIGLCQSGLGNDINKAKTDLLNKNVLENITLVEKNKYFLDFNKKINLIDSLSFLRTKGLISNYLTPVQNTIQSYSVLNTNTNNFDTYVYKIFNTTPAASIELNTKIYNFKFDLTQKVGIKPEESTEIQSQIFYSFFAKVIGSASYLSISNRGGFTVFFQEKLKELLPDCLIYLEFGLETSLYLFLISKKNIVAGDVIDALRIAADVGAHYVQSYDAIMFVPKDIFASNYGTDDIVFSINNKYPTNNISFLSELNNSLSIKDFFIWPAEPHLNSKPSSFLEIFTPDFSKMISSVPVHFSKKVDIIYPNGSVCVATTNGIQVEAKDKRFVNFINSEYKAISARFWTIFDYKTKTLSVVANCSNYLNEFEELGYEFNYLNLHCVLNNYNGIALTTELNAVRIKNVFNDPLYETPFLNLKQNFDNKIYYAGYGGSFTTSNICNCGVGIDRNNLRLVGHIKTAETDVRLCYKKLESVNSILEFNPLIGPVNVKGIVCEILTLSRSINTSTVEYSLKPFIYYNGSQNVFFDPAIRSSYLFKNCNPELQTETCACLITVKAIDLNESSTFLMCAEKLLLDNYLMSSDYRFSVSYDTPPVYSQNYIDSSLLINYYEINVGNASSYQSNLMSNDTGLTIKIPKSKKDKDGNLMRRYIKVTRKSHETLSPLISKRISLHKVTEIIPQRFSYPFSAIVGTKIDSRAFSQIPARTFHCKLKKVLIPSNYFIYDELEEDIRYKAGNGTHKIYDGDWDGTFKLGWTNNPAWVMLDLLINKRYGLGNFIESDQVDIWELYKISRWCDGVDDNGYYYGVSDLYGGVEPRHTFNALINDKFNIFDLINQVAAVFRGHVYYLNSLITFDDDRIKPIIGEFNNLDVKDGVFSYSNHKKDNEYTAVDVAFVDAKDNYKPKIEYVEDQDGIRQRGILKKQINAFGVSSRAQAKRFGLYFLYQTSKENSSVLFTTDTKILAYKPGDLIRINDDLMNSSKNFGKVLNIVDVNDETFQVTIDQNPNSLGLPTYDLSSITLYAPIAKQKYETFNNQIKSIPSSVNIFINSIFGLGAFYELKSGVVEDYDGFYRKIISGGLSFSGLNFNLIPFDTENSTKSFSGSVDVNYVIEKLTGVNGTPFNYDNSKYIISEEGPLESWQKNSNFIDFAQQDVLLENKFTVKEKLIGYLCYIKDIDINNNLSEKYGHWQFTIGNDIDPNFKLKFDASNKNAKNESFYDEYYFNLIDMSKLLVKNGLSELGEPNYIEAFSTLSKNIYLSSVLIDCYQVAHLGNSYLGLTYYGPHSKYSFYTGSPALIPLSCNYASSVKNNQMFNYDIQVPEYSNPVITYQDIIENDRPMIDSFCIKQISEINLQNYSGSVLTLSKRSANGIKKSTVANDLTCLMIGSSYSLTIANACEKIYKIMSITENYINEYNVTATEFNLNKFKEIEDNYEKDNLKSTFNAISAHEEAQRIEKNENLKIPIIISLDHFTDLNKNKFLILKWSNTQNASSYLIYLQTPSKQTSDYITEASMSDFNTSEKCFVKIIKIPTDEVGIFTVMIQSKVTQPFLLLSATAKRSINIFNF